MVYDPKQTAIDFLMFVCVWFIVIDGLYLLGWAGFWVWEHTHERTTRIIHKIKSFLLT